MEPEVRLGLSAGQAAPPAVLIPPDIIIPASLPGPQRLAIRLIQAKDASRVAYSRSNSVLSALQPLPGSLPAAVRLGRVSA